MSTDRIRNVNRQSKKLKNKTNHKYIMYDNIFFIFGRLFGKEVTERTSWEALEVMRCWGHSSYSLEYGG